MTSAGDATAHAVREVVHELSTTTGTVELIEKTLRALNRLVPADTVIFDEVSLQDGQTRGATHPSERVVEWADMMPLFEKWFFQSPNVQYFQANPHGSARRWSDGDIATFHAGELYRKFMAPLGIHYQLSFCVPAQTDAQRAFILNRGDRDFTDHEVVICDEIAPYLGVLFSTASQRTRAFVEGLDTSDTWTALVVDQSGSVISSAGADRHGVSDDGSLDETIRGWVRQALDERDLRLVVDPVSERLELGESGTVDVRLLPDPAGSHVLIIESVATERVDRDALNALSDRQAAVITELVAGGTNDQIAGRLGISVETVKKHLTSAYRVLGVSDRTSAVAAVRATTTPPAQIHGSSG